MNEKPIGRVKHAVSKFRYLLELILQIYPLISWIRQILSRASLYIINEQAGKQQGAARLW